VLVVGGAGELPGEVAGIGAQRPRLRARLLRQVGQRAARQARRARPRVAGAACGPRARAERGGGISAWRAGARAAR